MFDRLQKGWQLSKLSLKTIYENKSLMIFPIVSTLSLILVLASFTIGIFAVGIDNAEAYLIGAVFPFYLICYFLIIFFNSALIHCAMKIFKGEETSLGDGMSFASSRIGKILSWAFVSAIVGTLLNMLQNSNKVGEIIASIIGIVWSIMTFFVVPILIYEDKGVMESIKGSIQMMKEKWGESLVANFSFGIFQFLGILIGIVLGFVFGAIHPVLGVLVGGIIIALVSIATSAATTVFIAAVYSNTRDLPTGPFQADVLDAAFRQK